jgi:uncharacterized protein YqhQ
MRALTISANVQTGEDESLEGLPLYLTIAISLLFGIGLFFLLPAGAAHLTEQFFLSATSSSASNLSSWSSNLIEGGVRLALLIGYIYLVGQIEDIKRVFGYHGAEHKTINAFEAGEDLTPEKVTHHSIEHPRCGTAFLLTLILASILIFTLLGPLPLLWRLASRILLIPILAALSYEYIRWTAKNMSSPFVRLLIKPNLALQRLTTREPSLDMLEVAITSFNAMRAGEDFREHNLVV